MKPTEARRWSKLWWKWIFHESITLANASWFNRFVVVCLLIIIVSGAILFLALIGALPFKTQLEKEIWIEVNSQILNALFTISALYNTPPRAYYLTMYWFNYEKCFKKYPYPAGRTLLLLGLLNLNCWAQYVVAIAMFGWNYKVRPVPMVAVGLVTSFMSGMFGGIYEQWLKKNADLELKAKQANGETSSNSDVEEIEIPEGTTISGTIGVLNSPKRLQEV